MGGAAGLMPCTPTRRSSAVRTISLSPTRPAVGERHNLVLLVDRPGGDRSATTTLAPTPAVLATFLGAH